MKKIITYLSIIILSLLSLNCFSSTSVSSIPSAVSISNGKIKLSFDKTSGKIVSFMDVRTSFEYIIPKAVDGDLWKLDIAKGQASIENMPTRVVVTKKSTSSLEIAWKQEVYKKGPEIIVTVTLDKNKALSYWGIKVSKMKGCHIEKVQFPIVRGIKDIGDEDLAVASWLGNLIHRPAMGLEESMLPRTYSWNSPGGLSMQLVTLYNSQKKVDGLYFSCNDTLSYTKDFSLTFDAKYRTYSMTNVPSYDEHIDVYSPKYKAIIGSFDGDWITAAKIYRDWGIHQKWCRNSRFKNGNVAEWLPKTALWVWNRGRSSNVLAEAMDLNKKLGLPVNAYWHWWHNCSYDDYFPEYIPPREGRESFIKAVSDAQLEGVHCIVYMNSFQWGNSTDSWTEENAKPYSVKAIDGGDYSHTFNIFTNKSLTPMCMATDFWQNKYSTLCDTVVNHYHTNGVYMDQACMNNRCYDSTHGHEIGGGNYWVNGFGKLTSLIRSKISHQTQPILAGEGSGEDWIPYLDLFLTLDPSRERYAGVGNSEPIPLYQAVYHDYAITYGSYSSLVYPPYDEKWPAEYRPKNKETELPEIYNSQYLMEQSRAFVWGMQPTIANYHSFLTQSRKAEIDFLMDLSRTRYKALKYLLYGVYYRSPEIKSSVVNIDISKISIYAGRKGNTVTSYKETVPTIYSGAWKASDGCLGIALANISSKKSMAKFSIEASEYGLPKKGDVYLITAANRSILKSYNGNDINVEFSMVPLSTCVIEFVPK